MRIAFILIILVISVLKLEAQQALPDVNFYNIDISIDYGAKKLFADCELTVINNTQKEIDTLPILLYRLLNVTSITIDGDEIPYSQKIQSFNDFPLLQANSVNMVLPKQIKQKDSLSLKMTYNGYLRGYAETGLSYLKDNIDEEFTILRPESLVYPILGKPEIASLRNITSQSFSYWLAIEVPDSLVVVNGGNLLNMTKRNGYTKYMYFSNELTYQIVSTVANYKELQTDNIVTYFFNKDSLVAKNVHKKMIEAFQLYSNWWGNLKHTEKFSLIEIPEGYGSQATQNYIIQTATAFSEPEQLYELYHEISHLWNVKSNDKYPPRWNEGLAMFIQYLTLEKVKNEKRIDEKANIFIKDIKSDKEYGEIAMIDYGEQNVTDRSYRVGYLLFYFLYKTVGEDKFHFILKSYYENYYTKGSTTDEFVEHFIKLSKNESVKELFNDWLYTTKYFGFISDEYLIDNFIQRY